MQEFIARQNVLHFEDLLKVAKTEAERGRIQALLEDARTALEHARLAKWGAAHPE